ncbi:hypothetical protein [Nocardioides terrisoli]|uniref:hypothetical protein n=1 Tax=Nocardioides terrisoli TaxID=3388267 RepID=UPI00287BC3D0|nr:hypothetical protein [Nocardioides marmorisolisilvae]
MKTRLLPMAGAALALVALSGCAQSSQTAAQVGSQTISTSDLHLMTQALCTEQRHATGASAQPPSAISTVSNSALGALIESAIDRRYGDQHAVSYDKLTLAQEVNRLDPLISELPAADQARTRQLISDLFRGQMQVYQAATAQVRASGQAPTQQLVQQQVGAIESATAKKVDITVNPQYDTSGPGHGGDGHGSLSRAVSSDAKNSVSAQPDASWVANLPAGQKCG